MRTQIHRCRRVRAVPISPMTAGLFITDEAPGKASGAKIDGFSTTKKKVLAIFRHMP
jgi:hypothetical protein